MEAWRINGHEPSCREIGGGSGLSITINLALFLGNHVDQSRCDRDLQDTAAPEGPAHACLALVAAHLFDEAEFNPMQRRLPVAVS
jgi:hypothetical protein